MGDVRAFRCQNPLANRQRFHVYGVVVELNGIEITHCLALQPIFVGGNWGQNGLTYHSKWI